MTEYGDRINQLDLNISKTIRYGRASFQPKIDFFNLLNVSPVYAVRSAIELSARRRTCSRRRFWSAACSSSARS